MINLKLISFLTLFLCLSLSSTKSLRAKHNIEMTSLEDTSLVSNKSKIVPTNSYAQDRFTSRSKDIVGSKTQQNLQTKRIGSIGESILGDVLFGAFLFFAGFPCLWFNEKGYAYTKTFLRKYVTECLPVNTEEVDPNNEKKLICISGDSTTQDTVYDSDFGISVNNSIGLQRICQAQQWEQTRHTRRITNNYDEVYYSYDLKWSNSYISSSSFVEGGHQNNESDWLFDSKTQYAQLVKIGQFEVSETQKAQCEKRETVPIPTESLNFIVKKTGQNVEQVHEQIFEQIHEPVHPSAQPQSQEPVSPVKEGEASMLPQPQSDTESHPMLGHPVQLRYYQKYLTIKDDYIYFSKDLGCNSQGDFRVTFSSIPCGAITILGQQVQKGIETFHPEGTKEKEKKLDEYIDQVETVGCGACCACCGVICVACEELNAPISEINWVFENHMTKQQAFQSKLNDYEAKAWLRRLAGFLCFMLGIYLMLSPVYTLLYWFPLFGPYLGAIGSFICGLIGFLIAIPLTILTISFAWLYYRPVIGIPLLLIALLGLGYLGFQCYKDYQETPEQTVSMFF